MEENGCEHEGLGLDKERMALVPGLMGIILVAMVDAKTRWDNWQSSRPVKGGERERRGERGNGELRMENYESVTASPGVVVEVQK